MFFGRGLVATPADFGNQGRLPTHPAAARLAGDDVRRVGLEPEGAAEAHRAVGHVPAVVDADAEALEQDPANEWLARGPSYRLAAEQIRDGALAASGLLVRERSAGRASIRISRPGLWEALATRNATNYEQGKGDDLYRRSLYTVWKRSSPPPSAISFDAAERLFCTVSRQRTNTPLQSLVLLNDPQYRRSCARACGAHDRRRRRATRRPHHVRVPAADEPAAGARGARAARSAVSRRAARASGARAPPRRSCCRSASRSRRPGSTPADLAACTLVATTIMNFDEAVTSGSDARLSALRSRACRDASSRSEPGASVAGIAMR